MGEDSQSGILVCLHCPPETFAHVPPVQIDVPPGRGQLSDAGGYVSGRGRQDELGTVFQFQAILIQQHVLGTAADIEYEAGAGFHGCPPWITGAEIGRASCRERV